MMLVLRDIWMTTMSLVYHDEIYISDYCYNCSVRLAQLMARLDALQVNCGNRIRSMTKSLLFGLCTTIVCLVERQANR